MKTFKVFLEEKYDHKLNRHIDESHIIKFYHNILPKLEAAKRQFEQIVRGSLPKVVRRADSFNKAHSQQPVVLSTIKPVKSVISKVKRGKKIEEIGDMVRGAVLLSSASEVEEFIKQFVRKNTSIIDQHEVKKFGMDSTYGYYGSQHIDFRIDGLMCELQVMTQKLWKMKKYAHEIYERNRSNPAGMSKSDQMQSKNIFKTGNKPKQKGNKAKYQMEGIDPEINLLETLGDEAAEIIQYLVDNDRWKNYL